MLFKEEQLVKAAAGISVIFDGKVILPRELHCTKQLSPIDLIVFGRLMVSSF